MLIFTLLSRRVVVRLVAKDTKFRPRAMFSNTSTLTAEFRDLLHNSSNNILVLSGAGVSAESGIPTFRGAGGFWRKYVSQELATPEAFKANPSLVWEFYSYRRELVLSKKPNNAHLAIADFQNRSETSGKSVTVITQNIDGFHQAAGTKDVIELHGSLFKTRCTNCGDIQENRDSPIVPALAGKGAPDPETPDAKIPESELPKCMKCNSLLRPHVVWFGEALDGDVMKRTGEALEKCDMCLLVGTSSVVYPAAGFAPLLARKGVPVAEFNLEATSETGQFRFHFQGPAGETLPPLLAPITSK